MSNFSQFVGGGTPIGGTVLLPNTATSDIFTTNGQTFARTGKPVAYTSSYATAVTNGLAIKQWATSLNNTVYGGSASPFPTTTNFTTTGYPNWSNSSYLSQYIFAMGVWGRLTPIAINGLSGTNPTTYVFNSEDVGLKSPFTLRLPPQNPSIDNGTSNTTIVRARQYRSLPAYMSGPGLWVVVEPVYATANTSFDQNQITIGYHIYSSKDGATWEKAFLSVVTGLGYTGSVASFAVACSANTIFIGVAAARSTTPLTYILPVVLTPDRRSAAMTQAQPFVVDPSTTSSNLYLQTVSNDEVLFSALSFESSVTYRIFNVLTDATTWTTTQTSTNALYSIIGNRNFGFGRNSTTMVFFMPDGGVVKVGSTLVETLAATPKTVSGALTPTTAGDAYGFVYWTGSYFVVAAASSAGTYQLYYSATGATWNATNSTYAFNQPPMTIPSFLYKDKAILSDGSGGFANQVWSFATNAVVSPTLVDSGIPSNTDTYPWEFVKFGSDFYNIQASNVVVKVNSNLQQPDLVAYNTTTTGSTIRSSSRLKVVNGRLFVVNTANNYLFHSADGTTWTTVAISALNSISDVDYIGTNWVVSGTLGTNNIAYSSNLTTWTGVTVVSGSVTHLFNVGTALICFTSTGTALRRSTDGITWNTVTGAMTVSTSTGTYYDSATSTAYIFVPGTLPNISQRYVSTDGGATWGSASSMTMPIVQGKATNYRTLSLVPMAVVKFDGVNYCLMGTPQLAQSSPPVGSYIATTTDFLTFSYFKTFMPFGKVSSLFALDDDRLVGIGSFYPGNYLTTTDGFNLTQMITCKGTAMFVGSDTEVSVPGGVGYVRIA